MSPPVVRRALTLVLTLVLALCLACFAFGAHAFPSVGAEHPDVKLQDAWDRTYALSRFHGMPILVIYEDKDSARVNQALKDQLATLARGDAYRGRVALVAVADVGAYDYWPVRGFVKDAIRKESSKQGTNIYCDWDGGVRGGLGLKKGTSNVVLFSRSGKVLLAESGPMSAHRREELFDMIRNDLGG